MEFVWALIFSASTLFMLTINLIWYNYIENNFLERIAKVLKHMINKNFMNSILEVFKKDIVFTISFFLALVSCFIYTPKLHYIDFKVLASLFNLMIVVTAFEELKLLDMFAISILNKCGNSRRISLVLITLCFFCSMLITNDVALLTFVPLTLIISKKSDIPMTETIIFQTLAANIGSSLTPMGNPQNLFIFSHYGLTAHQFFITVIFFTSTGAIWLYLLNRRIKVINLDVTLKPVKIENRLKTFLWIALFFIITASILGVISYKTALLLTLLTALLLDKSLLLKIDYLLLATFLCFFIFIGNVSNIAAVNVYMSEHLKGTYSLYFGSILLSQFISNVPSAILLSKFTTAWKPLLLGVNIGGMGSIIASLASVISYKLFIRDNPYAGKSYMIKFSLYNLLGLIIFTLLNLYRLH